MIRLHCFAVLCFALAFSDNSRGGPPTPIALLRIASTGTMTGNADSAKEKAGHETLKRFIKEETGLDNEIIGQEKWHELSGKMAKGEFHLGVFQGHEFAWAQQKYPDLKPLALGINVHRYPVAVVVTLKNNVAKDFAGLKGQSIVVPVSGQSFPNMFLEHLCEANSLKANVYFSKVTSTENVEDALDEVVDGKTQVTIVDQATLEAYKRRKPGRFNQIKEIVRSQPFPPIIVASYGAYLDPATLEKFKNGLFSASRKDKGEMLLTLSRLTAFEPLPGDLAQVLADMRKSYPAKP